MKRSARAKAARRKTGYGAPPQQTRVRRAAARSAEWDKRGCNTPSYGAVLRVGWDRHKRRNGFHAANADGATFRECESGRPCRSDGENRTSPTGSSSRLAGCRSGEQLFAPLFPTSPQEHFAPQLQVEQAPDAVSGVVPAAAMIVEQFCESLRIDQTTPANHRASLAANRAAGREDRATIGEAAWGIPSSCDK